MKQVWSIFNFEINIVFKFHMIFIGFDLVHGEAVQYFGPVRCGQVGGMLVAGSKGFVMGFAPFVPALLIARFGKDVLTLTNGDYSFI